MVYKIKKTDLEIAKQIQMVVFDFDGVFTDNRVLVMQDGTEGVFCSRADGFGLSALRGMGIQLMVISKEVNPVVGMRCNKLRLPCIQGCDNKQEVLTRETRQLGISLERVAYVGNDINDIECLKVVGFPVCVADAWPPVKQVARYITKAKGGYGAVREFCDFIAEVKKGNIS